MNIYYFNFNEILLIYENMTRILLCFFFISSQLYSDTTLTKSRPMLWKITGMQLKSPSYLFGTFHTRDPEINKLSVKILHLLLSVDALYTEVLMSSRSEREVLALMQAQQSIPLHQRLTPKTMQYLNQYTKMHLPNFKPKRFSSYKTWAVALMIANQKEISLHSDIRFMDEEISHQAKKHHIKVYGLETPLDQLHYFDKLTKEEQELFLLDMLHQYEDPSYQNALKKWYKKGLAVGFTDLQKEFTAINLKQQALDTKLLDGLLYKRNQNFQHNIHAILQNKHAYSNFFAIGAGHLADKKGLVNTLKYLGYHLTPIN